MTPEDVSRVEYEDWEDGEWLRFVSAVHAADWNCKEDRDAWDTPAPGRGDAMTELHVIPVPFGMTAEDSWAEFEAMGEFVEYRWWKWRYWPGFRSWAVIRVEENPTDG